MIKHGSNNHTVKEIILKDSIFIEKKFGTSEDDQKKFIREIEFYKFCNKLNCKFVPKLEESNLNKRILLIEKINGKKINKFTNSFFEEAIDFIKFINKNINQYNKKIHAQENLLSINYFSDYLSIRLNKAIKNKKFLPYNFIYIADKRLKSLSKDNYDFGPIVLNPSDIGVHNVLKINKSFKFFDFEYAGLDSFAKMAYDFFLHPSNFQKDITIFKFFEKLSNELEISQQKPNEEIYKLFCLWWILRLLNQIDSENINIKIKMNLINNNSISSYIEQRLQLISRYWKCLND